MLKISGIIIIMASTAMLGIYFGKKEERRIKSLEEIKTALLIIKSEIGYSLSTLGQAVFLAAEKIDKPCGMIFLCFYERLEEKSGKSIGQMWEESIKENVNFINIKTEDIERLLMLSKTFCSADKQRCLSGIEAAVSYIDGKNIELRNEGIRSKKLYPPLCIFSGLILVIFLL